MEQISKTQAKSRLSSLINKTAETNEPILVAGEGNKAVLISEADWRSIQETLHLMSVPGLRQPIVEGMNQPLEEMISEADLYAELNRK